MCLIGIAYRVHKEYPLVIAANRDEYYSRPASRMHWWPELPYIFAGRDEVSKGTWLGVTNTGIISAVTNIRKGEHTGGSYSRGTLVSEALKSASPHAAAAEAAHQAGKYHPFNLLVGSKDELYYTSTDSADVQPVEPGIHVLSNAALNTPWPKTEQLRSAFAQAFVPQGDVPKPGTLFHFLSDEMKPHDRELPDTGVGLSFERFLSPAFIDGETYGTRSQTLIYVHYSGAVDVYEKTRDRAWQTHHEKFDVVNGGEEVGRKFHS
ncbi:uncharacterized protein with NRDE domain [Salsuginibacillus halophilus]|uniref:Uncharacterized protein with NRDE domain n=1 Tax=Salsuginibacillus halophilus TaxID=517424 RepID=A0A2P8HWH1_9BACI|nr:NRDE family protein [Salsuginibacillus halophilus]PSL50567.1 uncharacterized protein with NRDE domain [Salsuginibacillus halophilus]